MSSLKTRIEARRRSAIVPAHVAAAPLVPSRRVLPLSATRIDASEPGLIKIFGAPFIADPTGPTARRFFERAFGASAVESVAIDAIKGKAEIRYAFNGGDPRVSDATAKKQ